MPNFEHDDNSNEGEGWTRARGAPSRIIDRCAGCGTEVDTTGDMRPRCPACGACDWWRVDKLPPVCLSGQPGCCGARSSVTAHVCDECLDLVAVHDRCSRAEVYCMCPACEGMRSPRRARRCATDHVKTVDNPFDSDDWL